MPYPEEFIDLATDRVVGSTQHVADHTRIAAELNAIGQDLMEAKGSDASLSARLAAIAAGLLPESAADGLYVGHEDGQAVWKELPEGNVTESAVSGLFNADAADVEGGRLLLRRSEGTLARIAPARISGSIDALARGAKGDSATDDYAKLASLITEAEANKYRLKLPRATYRLSHGLNPLGQARLEGDSWGTVLKLDAGVDEDIVTLGNGTAIFGGVLEHITAEFGGGPRSGKAAFAARAVRFAKFDHLQAQRADIGFDARDNCYGASWYDPRAQDTCNVGWLVRPGPQSGADLPVFNGWLAGKYAGVVVERNGGGTHFHGGQIAGGSSLAAESDLWGSLLLGLTYLPDTTLAADVVAGTDTTISLVNASAGTLLASDQIVIGNTDGTAFALAIYTGRSGNTLTGVTWHTGYNTGTFAAGTQIRTIGSSPNLDATGVSFEGTNKRSMVRAWGGAKGVWLYSPNFNSNGANRAVHVFKGTRLADYQIGFIGAGVQGIFTGATPLALNTQSFSGFHVEERGTWTQLTKPTFNGVQMEFSKKPMVAFSSLSRAASSFEDMTGFGGKYMRWNGNVLEWSTDPLGTTWTAV